MAYNNIPLRARQGFTLVELVIASLIFSFMIASLSTIYSAANKHMFQNYRQNTVKSKASLAMKVITTKLQEATRIDMPAPGAAANVLAFATNVDQVSGCYPLQDKTSNKERYYAAPAWHYFCIDSGKLYYHTDGISGTLRCPAASPYPAAGAWGVSPNTYNVPTCGILGSGTVTLLSDFVSPAPFLFSRQPSDGAIANELVNIRLKVLWDPAAPENYQGHDLREEARAVETILNTVVRINLSK